MGPLPVDPVATGGGLVVVAGDVGCRGCACGQWSDGVHVCRRAVFADWERLWPMIAMDGPFELIVRGNQLACGVPLTR